ncbi:MucB/RseB C-terminal domain-containing protein [Neisseria sp. Ec49-e6-T10]|uniref:MucB/RseB C-terminal domain-containing protein n=1 Tax=Neisseria sp. Ec49-e6-T10 TaxID=3140744 RepID=UPI003EB984BF
MFSKYIVGVLAVFFVQVVYASDWDELKHLNQSGSKEHFSGSYISQLDGRVGSFRIDHALFAGIEFDKRVATSGLERELIKKGDTIRIYAQSAPAFEAARIDHLRAFPFVLPKDMTHLSKSYNLKNNGLDRVAGRECQKYIVQAKDRSKYNQRLCVDKQTGVTLRQEIYFNNKPIEVQSFSEITFKSIPKARFNGNKKLKLWNERAISPISISGGYKSLSKSSEPILKGLPEGFSVIGEKAGSNRKDKSAKHYILTDGLIQLSLFVEPAQNSYFSELSGGKTQAYSLNGALSIASLNKGIYRLTILGFMPPQSLRSILNTVSTVK